MTTVYQLWYIREASVAIWVGNLICCWQLFQRLFHVRSFDDKSDEIVAQPEMERRNHKNHPSQYSVGGSPKTTSWFAKQREKMYFLGAWSLGEWSRQYVTKPSQSGDSQPPRIKSTWTFTSTMSGTTYTNSPAIPQTTRVPTILMTLNRDGDNAAPAIAYRNQEEMV